MMRTLAAANAWGAACVFAAASAAPAFAELAPTDVVVNTYTTGRQTAPAVAIDANDNFVVVWESPAGDGHREGIFGRRFDLRGAPLGPEFQVNSYTTDAQRYPAIAMRSAGDFVVVWQSFGQDGDFGGIFGQLYDAMGNPVGTEFQVNAGSTNAQRSPAVVMDEAGGFVVVWQGYTSPAAQWDVWARRFDAGGGPLGPEFVVNDVVTQQQNKPAIAMDAAGNFVVAWQSYDVPLGCGTVRSFARRFDSAGLAQGPAVAVGSDTTRAQLHPRVAMTDAGEFMVVWDRPDVGGPGFGCDMHSVAGRVFDASATPVGPDVTVDAAPPPVNGYDRLVARWPSVAADDTGHFVVAWGRSQYRYHDDDNYGYYDPHVRARRYGPDGTAIDASSRAVTGGGGLGRTSIDSRRPGWFVVAWTAWNGLSYDVFARPPDAIFADDFDSRDLTHWSTAAVDGGDLAVTAAARMGSPVPSPYGLQAAVDDRAGIFVQDDSPDAEPRYRARFYLDPNGYDPGLSLGHVRQHVFIGFAEAPQKRLLLVIMRRLGDAYSIATHVRRDDNTQAMTPFVPIADAPNTIEIDWQRAGAPGANDGRLEMWVNGVSAATLTGLDNDERGIDFVRMGAMSVRPGASGTLYFDEFVSRRLAYIGP